MATYADVVNFLKAHGVTPTGNQRLDGMRAQGFHDEDEAKKDPRVAALIASGGSGRVVNAYGDADANVTNGRITNITRGSQSRAIALTAATAGAVFAPEIVGALAGGGGAAAPAAAATDATALGPVAAAGGTTAATVPTSLAAAGTTTPILSTLSRIAPVAQDVGQTLTGAGTGLANERQENDRARVQAAQLNLNAPLTRAQQVAKGDLMAADIPQSQRVGSGRDVSFTGGVGPQDFTQDTVDAGNALKRSALTKLMTGEPEYTPTPPSTTENVLSGAGVATSLLGALSRYGRR